jgi:hypothetical protein
MTHERTVARIGLLQAVTVERGASPAEAATAASLARRLMWRRGHGNRTEPGAMLAPRPALAPGVHVSITS